MIVIRIENFANYLCHESTECLFGSNKMYSKRTHKNALLKEISSSFIPIVRLSLFLFELVGVQSRSIILIIVTIYSL